MISARPISRVLDELRQYQCRHRELMRILERRSEKLDCTLAFERFYAESRSLHTAVRRCLYARALETQDTEELATQCIYLSGELDKALVQLQQHPTSSEIWQSGFSTVCQTARRHWDKQNELIVALEHILDEAEQRDLLHAFRVLKSVSFLTFSQT